MLCDISSKKQKHLLGDEHNQAATLTVNQANSNILSIIVMINTPREKGAPAMMSTIGKQWWAEESSFHLEEPPKQYVSCPNTFPTTTLLPQVEAPQSRPDPSRPKPRPRPRPVSPHPRPDPCQPQPREAAWRSGYEFRTDLGIVESGDDDNDDNDDLIDPQPKEAGFRSGLEIASPLQLDSYLYGMERSDPQPKE